MKYKSLAGIKQITLEHNNMANSHCYSPDVGDRSFKIVSSISVETSNVASKVDSIADVDLRSKKTKMSRLSLKRLLNNAPQSNLDKFLDMQSVSTALKIGPVDRSKKIKKSNKNLSEKNDLEGKSIYKVSNSIFGTVKSKSKLQNCAKSKKSIREQKCVEKSIESQVEIPKIKVKLGRRPKKRSLATETSNKIELVDKFNDKLDEKLQEGLEIELEHCEGDNNIPTNLERSLVSIKPGSSKIAIDLTSENNLELELIANRSKARKCKSLELTKAKSLFTPRKVRFSHEIKSFSPEKETRKEYKNSFEFLMDMRHKVDSPGKDKQNMLQEWADHKGNTGKRKMEDEERDYMLQKGSKRLKKLLNCDQFTMKENDYANEEKRVEEINFTKRGVNSRNVIEENSNYTKKMVKKRNSKENSNKLRVKIISPLNVSKTIQESLDFDDSYSRDVPIICNEDSSDSITTKRSFPIFQTAKSPPKLANRKPLQQTLLFCISNIDNSSNFCKEDNVIKVSQEKRKSCVKNVEKSSKYLGMESSTKKLKTARRSRIIDSDDSSRDSTTSKSSLNSTKATDKVKLQISTADTLKKQEEIDEKSQLNRRSSRVRKTIGQYDDVEISAVKDVMSKKVKSEIVSNNDCKVASVFLKAFPRPKVDLEARRNFLYAASPPIKKKETILIENDEFDPFPKFSHTQQRTNSNFWSLPSINRQNTICSSTKLLNNSLQLGSFTNCNNTASNKVLLRKITQIQNKKNILLNIKAKNPNFPVYKTYKLLKAKNRHAKVSSSVVDLNKTVPRKLLDDSCLIIDNDSETTFVQNDLATNFDEKGDLAANFDEKGDLATNFDSATLWTDKYKPTSSEDIIGNRSAAVDLLKFLKDRLLHCNDSTKRKKLKKSIKISQNDSSDDDFVSSDDSKDIRLPSGNTMLIRGPHGSGKTASIYAVCQELDINVLELNASSKRTGRILIQKLQEATQSEQIHKQKESPQQDKTLSKMCVLLVEDIDVVFEQDEGFVTALTQLLQTTKRPILLTFTDETNAIVQKFIQQYPVITFLQLSAETCSCWLQLICLLENLLIEERCLGELLEWNKGDLRRTILQLQFWGLTGGDSLVKTDDFARANQMRFLRRLSVDTVDIMDHSNTSEVNESVLHDVEEFQHENVVNSMNDGFVKSCNLGQIWWNFSGILKERDTQRISSLQSVQTFYDSLSISDLLGNKFGCLINNSRDLEPTFTTFQTKLKDSLSLDNFEDYFTGEKDHFRHITDFMVDRSFSQLMQGQRKRYKFNMGVPEAADRRWRFKQHSCQEAFSDKLPLNISLDRKSFALDYFPMLITIVKIEQARLKTYTKRRNRFYSYLRSLGLQFNDSQIKCLNSAFVKAAV